MNSKKGLSVQGKKKLCTLCTLHGSTLLRLLSLHPYSDNVCPAQGFSSSMNSESISAHFLAEHISLDIIEHCMDCLINFSHDT